MSNSYADGDGLRVALAGRYGLHVGGADHGSLGQFNPHRALRLDVEEFKLQAAPAQQQRAAEPFRGDFDRVRRPLAAGGASTTGAVGYSTPRPANPHLS